jgi:peptidoglycan/xylan/chitin deacetylase (PgdA/CDA1 family)
MDHDHYDWSPVVSRERLRWPQGARVALATIVVLDHLDFGPPEGSVQPPGLYHRPLPEYWAFTHRQYGLRVGVFRVLEALARHDIRPTIAMDALTAENCPYLVRHCVEREFEIIGHGMAVSRMITSRMTEADERHYIGESLESLVRATGRAPQGWLGPEFGESARTPGLLAEAGIRYVCDWANDEQPYPMKTPSGELFALPMILDLDDVFALRDRRFPIDGYTRTVKQAFDRVYRDAVRSGRLFVLTIHPYLMGQPFRIGFLDDALRHMRRRKGVWSASGGEIVEWYSQAASTPHSQEGTR